MHKPAAHKIFKVIENHHKMFVPTHKQSNCSIYTSHRKFASKNKYTSVEHKMSREGHCKHIVQKQPH